jgi:hypothetical protein
MMMMYLRCVWHITSAADDDDVPAVCVCVWHITAADDDDVPAVCVCVWHITSAAAAAWRGGLLLCPDHTCAQPGPCP